MPIWDRTIARRGLKVKVAGRYKAEKLKQKKRICSEVSVNSPGIRGVSPEEEKEGYGGKDLQRKGRKSHR